MVIGEIQENVSITCIFAARLLLRARLGDPDAHLGGSRRREVSADPSAFGAAQGAGAGLYLTHLVFAVMKIDTSAALLNLETKDPRRISHASDES